MSRILAVFMMLMASPSLADNMAVKVRYDACLHAQVMTAGDKSGHGPSFTGAYLPGFEDCPSVVAQWIAIEAAIMAQQTGLH